MNVNPDRSWPNAASAWKPASAPGARTTADAWDIDRPRRTTSTTTSTSPAGTGLANTPWIERSTWSVPSSASMARAAMAASTPPCGTIASIHCGPMVAR